MNTCKLADVSLLLMTHLIAKWIYSINSVWLTVGGKLPNPLPVCCPHAFARPIPPIQFPFPFQCLPCRLNLRQTTSEQAPAVCLTGVSVLKSVKLQTTRNQSGMGVANYVNSQRVLLGAFSISIVLRHWPMKTDLGKFSLDKISYKGKCHFPQENLVKFPCVSHCYCH